MANIFAFGYVQGDMRINPNPADTSSHLNMLKGSEKILKLEDLFLADYAITLIHVYRSVQYIHF